MFAASAAQSRELDFELLVVRTGGSLVGLETSSISGISKPLEDDGAAVHLSAFLWGRSPEEGDVRTSRVVLVQKEEVDGGVVVDAIEGYDRAALSDLDRVPAVVRAHGSPAWLIGFWRREQALVPLIDIVQLFRQASSEGRHGQR